LKAAGKIVRVIATRKRIAVMGREGEGGIIKIDSTEVAADRPGLVEKSLPIRGV